MNGAPRQPRPRSAPKAPRGSKPQVRVVLPPADGSEVRVAIADLTRPPKQIPPSPAPARAKRARPAPQPEAGRGRRAPEPEAARGRPAPLPSPARAAAHPSRAATPPSPPAGRAAQPVLQGAGTEQVRARRPRATSPAPQEASQTRAPVLASRRPEGIGAFAELAFRHLRLGDVEQAFSIFESLTVLDPTEPYYWLGLGVAAERRDDHAAAERGYRRAAELDPRDPVPHVGLAELSLARGQPRPAHAYLTRALERARASRDGTELAEEVEARLRLLARAERKGRR